MKKLILVFLVYFPLNIISDKSSKNIHTKIVNNLGEIVYTMETDGYFQIPAYMQSGIYHLMIDYGDMIETQSLIIK